MHFVVLIKHIPLQSNSLSPSFSLGNKRAIFRMLYTYYRTLIYLFYFLIFPSLSSLHHIARIFWLGWKIIKRCLKWIPPSCLVSQPSRRHLNNRSLPISSHSHVHILQMLVHLGRKRNVYWVVISGEIHLASGKTNCKSSWRNIQQEHV